MHPTEKELDLARGYLRGDYTEVQFNYLAHQHGSDKQRMNSILEKMSSQMPLATAAKFILICIALNFLVCTIYSIVNFTKF